MTANDLEMTFIGYTGTEIIALLSACARRFIVAEIEPRSSLKVISNNSIWYRPITYDLLLMFCSQCLYQAKHLDSMVYTEEQQKTEKDGEL